jgi:clan AA aspartic protease (TIGR02281 family)
MGFRLWAMKHSVPAKIIGRIMVRVLTLFLLTAGSSLAAEVPLVAQGGVYMVPVRINDALTVNFVVDSGATEVQIPADVAQTLLRKGALRERDFIQDRIYTMADGSQVRSERILIRRLQIGDKIVEGVTASIGNVRSPPLIGQSLLYRFPSWSLDNRRHVLILGSETPPPAPAAVRPPSRTQTERPVEPPSPPRPPGSQGRDSRDKRLLRLLCGRTDAKKLLDCSETP